MQLHHYTQVDDVTSVLNQLVQIGDVRKQALEVSINMQLSRCV